MKQMLHVLIIGGPRKAPPSWGGGLAWVRTFVNIEHECTFANIGDKGLELGREEFMSFLLRELLESKEDKIVKSQVQCASEGLHIKEGLGGIWLSSAPFPPWGFGVTTLTVEQRQAQTL